MENFTIIYKPVDDEEKVEGYERLRDALAAARDIADGYGRLLEYGPDIFDAAGEQVRQ